MYQAQIWDRSGEFVEGWIAYEGESIEEAKKAIRESFIHSTSEELKSRLWTIDDADDFHTLAEYIPEQREVEEEENGEVVRSHSEWFLIERSDK